MPVGENSIPLPVNPADSVSRLTQVVMGRDNGQPAQIRAGETPTQQARAQQSACKSRAEVSHLWYSGRDGHLQSRTTIAIMVLLLGQPQHQRLVSNPNKPHLMSNLFLLPCPLCDAKNEISLRQSGQNLACTGCGKDIEAPKLGEIKKLPLVESTTGTKRAATMSATRKGLFTVGLALAVLFGGAGLGLHLYARSLHTPIDIDQYVQLTREEVRSLETRQLYGLATSLSKMEDLGDFAEPAFLKGNKQGAILMWVAYGLYAIGAIGLMMLLGSFLMK